MSSVGTCDGIVQSYNTFSHKDLKKSMMKQKLHTPFIKQIIVYINSITKMTPTSESPKMKLKKLFHFTVTSSHTM